MPANHYDGAGPPMNGYRMIPPWFCVLFAFLVPVALLTLQSSANAAPPLVLETGSTHERIGRHFVFLEAPRGALDLDDARERFDAGAFRPIERDVVDFGLIKSGYWLTMALRNGDDVAGEWVLDTGRPFLRHLDIWIEGKGVVRSILSVNRDSMFEQRQRPQRILVSRPFQMTPQAERRVWIYLESDSTSTLPIRLYASETAALADFKSEVSLIVFYTVALILLLFVFAFAFALSSRVSLYYCGFFALILAYNAQLNGTLFQYVWPEFPRWNALASHPIGLGAIIMALLMAREFNKPGKTRSILNAIVLAVVGIAAVYILAPAILPLTTAKTFAGPIVLTFLALQVVLSAVAIRDGIPGAKFYVLGSVVLFGYIGVFTALSQGHWLVGSANKEIIVRYGQLLDGMIYCLAVVRQTWVLRRTATRSEKLAERRALELATTRHDIRQPLLSLRMALDTLPVSGGSEARMTRSRLVESLAYLEELVKTRGSEDVVVAHEIKAGDGGQKPDQAFPLSVVIDNAAFMFADEARARGMTLTAVKSSVMVAADPIDLLRILTNLVSNAVQHSGADKVLIGARRNNRTATINVIDNGRGMSPDRFEQMKRLYRAGDESAGEGLGLGVVCSLAQSNGWQIKLRGTPGSGAHFEISGLSPA